MSSSTQGHLSSEQLLQERQRLEQLYQEKFTREITVMFTDLKDSTALTESKGDMTAREIIQTHNNLLFPLIEKHSGKLVKTMGDGTMSYFEDAQQAQRAAVAFQQMLAQHNQLPHNKILIKVRIGINTGTGIVEENDIYGDVVNVAARFESLAEASEIYMSESTYHALTNKGEFYSRIVKQATLKGKSEQVQVYKVFWCENEIERDKEIVQSGSNKKTTSFDSRGLLRVIIFISVTLLAVFLIMHLAETIEQPSGEEERSKVRSVSNLYYHFPSSDIRLKPIKPIS